MVQNKIPPTPRTGFPFSRNAGPVPTTEDIKEYQYSVEDIIK